MPHNSLPSGAIKVAAILLFVFFIAPGNGILFGQQGPPPLPPPGQTLTPDQLDDLVAPIALYPDPVVEPDHGGLHISSGSGPSVPVAHKESRAYGTGADSGGPTAELGPEHPGVGGLSGCPEALERRRHLDHQSRERISFAAAGCDGRGPAHAAEGGAGG